MKEYNIRIKQVLETIEQEMKNIPIQATFENSILSMMIDIGFLMNSFDARLNRLEKNLPDSLPPKDSDAAKNENG